LSPNSPAICCYGLVRGMKIYSTNYTVIEDVAEPSAFRVVKDRAVDAPSAEGEA